MIKKVKSFLFKNTSTNQIIAKNTFWLSFSQLIRKLIKFSLIIYAARVLGVEGYGVFAYALGLAGFFAMFSDIGINSLLIRDFSTKNKITPKHLSTFLYIKLALVGISALLILYIAPFLANIPEVLPLILIMAILIVLDGLRDFAVAIIRSKEKMELEAGVDALTNITTLILGISALIVFESSMSLAVAYVIGSGVGLVFSVLILRNELVRAWRYFDKKLAKKILKDAWPFALIGLFGAITTNTDIIMLGWLKNALDVGLYSVALKPVQAIYLISGVLAISILPRISRLVRDNGEKVGKLLGKSIGLLFLIGMPMAVGGMILGKEIMVLLYGVEYIGSTLAFQILLATTLTIFPMSMIISFVLAHNKQSGFIAPLLVSAIVNIVLNYALIPIYGIAGAALATVIAQFFAVVMMWNKMKKIDYFTVLPYMWKILLAVIFMTIFTIAMKFFLVNSLVNVVISALIYFVSLKILKEPLIEQVRSIIGK